MDDMYRFKGTNGSLGLITGNRYGVSTERDTVLADQINARIYLTNNPVKVGIQKYAHRRGIAVPFVPYVVCIYDNQAMFDANWQQVEKCRCTNPGEDDGSNTCWTHHDCTKGDCTHGE